jgi:hypothetical protein
MTKMIQAMIVYGFLGVVVTTAALATVVQKARQL